MSHPPLRRVSHGFRKVSPVGDEEPQRIRSCSANNISSEDAHAMATRSHSALCHSKTLQPMGVPHLRSPLTISNSTIVTPPPPPKMADATEENLTRQCVYFGRLGYEEKRVLEAVHKCVTMDEGGEEMPDNDKVLAQLIKMGRIKTPPADNMECNAKVKRSPPSVAGGPQLCPYGRKCTYGAKCKYAHPERTNGTHLTAAERLMKCSERKPLAATSSLDPHQLLVKQAISRTHSLNVAQRERRTAAINASIVRPPSTVIVTPPPQPTDQSPVPPIWPWLTPSAVHPSLARHSSAPQPTHHHMMRPGVDLLPPIGCNRLNAGSVMAMGNGMTTDSWSLADSALGSAGSSGESIGATNFFTPSTAVWGAPEYGLTSPLHTPHLIPKHDPLIGRPSDAAARANVYYHLSSLFPEHQVLSVMNDHQHVRDAGELCTLIAARMNTS